MNKSKKSYVRLTLQALQVLKFIMDHERVYGVEVRDGLGITSGTLYPILNNLEAKGWLKSEVEQRETPFIGSPTRKYYMLTSLGLKNITEALETLS